MYSLTLSTDSSKLGLLVVPRPIFKIVFFLISFQETMKCSLFLVLSLLPFFSIFSFLGMFVFMVAQIFQVNNLYCLLLL